MRRFLWRSAACILPLGVIGSFNQTPQGYTLLIIGAVMLALSTD